MVNKTEMSTTQLNLLLPTHVLNDLLLSEIHSERERAHLVSGEFIEDRRKCARTYMRFSGGSRGGGGSRGSGPPPFVPRCRLFNIGPKIGPPSGPPFFAGIPNLDPPLSKILDPPLRFHRLLSNCLKHKLSFTLPSPFNP